MSKTVTPWVCEVHFLGNEFEPNVTEHGARVEAEGRARMILTAGFLQHTTEGGAIFLPIHRIARIVVAPRDR